MTDHVLYERDGVTYEVVETDAYVGELTRCWGKRRALREAADANAARIAPSLRYAIRHVGFGRWAVIGLQNQLVPPGSVPDAGIIPRSVLDPVEDTINAELGLPPSWRCSCGGRPFVGKACPRCGNTGEHGGVVKS